MNAVATPVAALQKNCQAVAKRDAICQHCCWFGSEPTTLVAALSFPSLPWASCPPETFVLQSQVPQSWPGPCQCGLPRVQVLQRWCQVWWPSLPAETPAQRANVHSQEPTGWKQKHLFKSSVTFMPLSFMSLMRLPGLLVASKWNVYWLAPAAAMGFTHCSGRDTIMCMSATKKHFKHEHACQTTNDSL